MGQALIDRHFGHQVKNAETFQDADVYYRLLEDDDTSALNAGPSDCEPRPGIIIWDFFKNPEAMKTHGFFDQII